MSRIGKRPVTIPEDVTVTIDGHNFSAKGPKGELTLKIHPHLKAEAKDNQVQVSVAHSSKLGRALYGTTARFIANIIEGVHEGFTKQLEIQGVGYRAAIQGQELTLNLGFSHPVIFKAPEGIELTVQKNIIDVKGIDKQLVGQVAASIRSFRPPEPYKGKGIRYVNEHVRRKAGKAAKAAGAA